MADVTLSAGGADLDVGTGHLCLPLVGAWTAHLVLSDADSPPTGKVTLTWLGSRLEGYVLRSGVSEGQVKVLVSGGAGGLWKSIQGQMYDYQLAVSMPLQAILSAAGERLSGASTTSILSTTLPCWIRQAGEAGALLDALADAVGAIWQVQLDGSVFFGTPAWSEADFAETRDYEPVDFDPTADIAELAPMKLGVTPGQTFSGRRVWTAEYSISPERAGLRLWYLPDGDGAQLDDPLGLRALIKETMRGVDLYALYPGKVVQQRPNGTLDVLLDNKRFPSLTSVKYAVPVPGAKLTVGGGARVLVAFEEGDIRRARAQLWEPGSGGHAVAREGDQVDCGTLQTTAVQAGPVVTLTLLWIPPGGGAPQTLGAIAATGTGTAGTVVLTGKIKNGSPHISLP